MVTIRSFKGLRPQKELAEKVASLPYDVLNSKEARVLAKGNPYAFYKVGKSEVDLPEDINLYDERVYQNSYHMSKAQKQDIRQLLQIENNKNLLLGYAPCSNPDREKRVLLKKYKDIYAALPFANIRS